MKYKLVHELIASLEEFEQETKLDSVEDFRIWLNEKHYKAQSPKFISEKQNREVNDLENEIAKQVILLSRFSKQTIRRGLQDFPELVNEEFTYLYRLVDEPNLTKMQLVEKNAHEKQTGMVFIKRLVKNGLIEEVQDDKDKRVTHLKVTEAGKNVFNQSVKEVTEISKILSADLSQSEKDELLRLLRKLNEFHSTVYHQFKNKSIEEIKTILLD